jgi:hypothetical protein
MVFAADLSLLASVNTLFVIINYYFVIILLALFYYYAQ